MNNKLKIKTEKNHLIKTMYFQVAYFQLGSNDRVNNGDLRQALDGVPAEIIANLEAQIANAQ